jgi:hypothetical protein
MPEPTTDRYITAVYSYCRATARACQLTRGLLPMLATPGPNGDAVLEAAVIKAAMAGLVAPKHHVVVLQQIHNDLCVKVRRCMRFFSSRSQSDVCL